MVKIGVIGAGHLGRIHIEQLLCIPGIQLIGVYDINQSKAKLLASLFSIPYFISLYELLEKCDAVDIVSATSSHFEIAQQAIRASKHLFIEKPMTSTLEEAELLVNMCKEGNVKCMIGHTERFNPALIAVQQEMPKPLFIEAHRLAKFPTKNNETNVILDLMIYDIDIVLSIVKSEIKRISASGFNVVGDSIDIANVRLEFSNGCVANLTASRIAQSDMCKMRIFQKDSYYSVDFLTKQTDFISILKKNMQHQVMTMDAPDVPVQDAIHIALTSFRDCILHNSSPIISVQEGFLTMEVAYKILKKINLHGEE